MAISNKSDNDEIVSDINMTPLIDVMLVLLIIFMVSSSAALESGLSVDLPEANTVSSAPQSSLIITMSKKGEISVGGNITALSGLKEAVAAELKKLNTTSVVLEGDGDSSLTSAIDVMDIAREAGAKDFSIAAKAKN